MELAVRFIYRLWRNIVFTCSFHNDLFYFLGYGSETGMLVPVQIYRDENTY
jgi:hypothetical protein